MNPHTLAIINDAWISLGIYHRLVGRPAHEAAGVAFRVTQWEHDTLRADPACYDDQGGPVSFGPDDPTIRLFGIPTVIRPGQDLESFGRLLTDPLESEHRR